MEPAIAEVTRLENKWVGALNIANVDVIAEILADDFVRPAPDYGHFVNKADLLAFYRSHLSRQSSNEIRIEDMTVTLYGSTALARGTVTKTNSEGKPISKQLFTDVFVRNNGQWQVVSAQENPITAPQVVNH
jgi:ketosteroid isomerase-like protein